MKQIFKDLTDRILENDYIKKEEVYNLSDNINHEYLDLFYLATKIREKFKGNNIDLCSVVNAKSGGCPEDCKFCAQSSISNAFIDEYPLMTVNEILDIAIDSQKKGARRFCISLGGRGIGSNEDLRVICNAISKIKEIGLFSCATLGIIDEYQLLELKKAGIDRYHHNLETSESFFPKVCTTHTYKEKWDVVKMVKDAGISVCCGGIIGIGEEMKDRIDMAFAIKELDVDSTPMNFLMTIPGTPLENIEEISAMEILKTIAIFRFILPTKDIRICGGRSTALGDLHPLIFLAGANSLMIGNYLTQTGRDPSRDIQMIKDLGFGIWDGN